MNDQTKQLSRAARKLTPQERAQLADDILESLAPTDAALDRKWLAESLDRLEAFRRGEMPARDFDEVLAKFGRS